MAAATRAGPADTGLAATQQCRADQCQTAATAQRHEFCQCVAQKTAPAAVGGGVIKRMLSAPGPKRLPSGCRRSESHATAGRYRYPPHRYSHTLLQLRYVSSVT